MSPQSIKIEIEDMDTDKITMGTGIAPIAETEISLTIEKEVPFTKTEVIGPVIELEVDQEFMGMEIATEGINSSQNYRRDNYRQDWGNQRYRDRSPSQDCSRSRQRYRSNSRDNFRNRSFDRSQSRNRDRSSSRQEEQRSRTKSRDRNRENRSTTRSRSNSCVNTNRYRQRCFRCSEYDHLARECPNTLTDNESDSESEDLDDSTWQMLSQDETSSFQDIDMQDLNR